VLQRSTAKFRRLYERQTTIERVFANMMRYSALGKPG
jgi:hypothetical protein